MALCLRYASHQTWYSFLTTQGDSKGLCIGTSDAAGLTVRQQRAGRG
jgi:hypothetical protein